jgi:hypothetical protein
MTKTQKEKQGYTKKIKDGAKRYRTKINHLNLGKNTDVPVLKLLSRI